MNQITAMCGLICSECDDYACEKLEAFFRMVPDAKKQLDGIRAGL